MVRRLELLTICVREERARILSTDACHLHVPYLHCWKFYFNSFPVIQIVPTFLPQNATEVRTSNFRASRSNGKWSQCYNICCSINCWTILFRSVLLIFKLIHTWVLCSLHVVVMHIYLPLIQCYAIGLRLTLLVDILGDNYHTTLVIVLIPDCIALPLRLLYIGLCGYFASKKQLQKCFCGFVMIHYSWIAIW